MFSPQEQQIEICLLKSNLEEIENDLVVQHSSLPVLDEENEQKYRATLAELRTVRSLSTELERLKQENMRLTIRRMQLKRQCEDLNKAVETTRESRNELTNLLNQEEHEIELKIRQYEESLQEKADRFRKTRGFYNEEEVKVETNKVNGNITELGNELTRRRGVVDDLKRRLDAISPDVPENILDIMGNSELDDKINLLTEKRDALVEKRNFLLNQKSNTVELSMNKF